MGCVSHIIYYLARGNSKGKATGYEEEGLKQGLCSAKVITIILPERRDS